MIVLSHDPDLFPGMPDRVALTLSGHTHGGQVAIPLLRRPLMPSYYGERYARGHIVEHGRHLSSRAASARAACRSASSARPRSSCSSSRPD